MNNTALKLAEDLPALFYSELLDAEDVKQAAAELRRLQALNAELVEALESVLDSLGALTKQHELLDRMSEEDATAVFAALAKAKAQP
jgi:hypothetical protein